MWSFFAVATATGFREWWAFMLSLLETRVVFEKLARHRCNHDHHGSRPSFSPVSQLGRFPTGFGGTPKAKN